MRGNKALILLVIALVAGSVLAFLITYFDIAREKQPSISGKTQLQGKTVDSTAEEPKGVVVTSPVTETPQEEFEQVFGQKAAESLTMKAENECQRVEKEIKEFFTYLDNKEYIKELNFEEGTLAHFEKILQRLSSEPPLPAGEGFNYDMIIKNIYHFYRVLGLKDVVFLQRILKHEADTMEINLALFCRWIALGEECSNLEGLRPSLETLYTYAGFLINTIGGRAYLFRRNTRLRLLATYYCFLIIHEADKKKVNRSGIDIAPFLESLAEEIENCQGLYFRKEYAGKLIDFKNYYSKKGRPSASSY